MKRILAVFLVLVLLAPAMAFGAEEAVTITYYDWQLTESPANEIIREHLSAYEAAHPNVKIEYQPVPTPQRLDKLLAMVIGGEAPDIVLVNDTGLNTFIPMGALEPLNRYLDQAPELSGQLVPSVTAYAVSDGVTYGIPRFATANALLYNGDYFREVGLDPDHPPTSWAELLEAAQALTRDTDGDGKIDRWGMGLIGAKLISLNYRYWWLFWGAGGEILNEDWTESRMDSQASLEALTFYTDLYTKYGVVPPGVTEVEQSALVNDFATGRTAMIVDGPFQIPTIRKVNPGMDLRVALLPAKEEGYPHATYGGGAFYGISSTSKHKDIAWDIIAYMSNAENNADYAIRGSFLPVRFDTAEKILVEGDPLISQFTPSLKTTRAVPRIPQMAEIGIILAEEIQFVFIGEKTPQEATLSLHERTNALLHE